MNPGTGQQKDQNRFSKTPVSRGPTIESDSRGHEHRSAGLTAKLTAEPSDGGGRQRMERPRPADAADVHGRQWKFQIQLRICECVVAVLPGGVPSGSVPVTPA